MPLDLPLLLGLTKLVADSPSLAKLAIFLANNLVYLLILSVILFPVCGFIKKFAKYKNQNLKLFFLATVSAVIARFVFAEIIRFFYNRPRPFEVVQDVVNLINHEKGGSFPSGHATASFAIAAAVAMYYPKTSIAFFAAAVLMGLGRVAAGVHWPSDIIGGALVGILTPIILRKFMRK